MNDYNTKMHLIWDCKSKREYFAKGNCLSVVNTVVNKMCSNVAFFENYKSTLKA